MQFKLAYNWKTVQTLGLLSVIMAGLNTLFGYLMARHNAGLDIANVVLAFLGVVCIVISGCLQKFEARIARLESTLILTKQ